jgi:hypothetical protein
MRSESAIVELSVGSLVAPVFLQPFLPLAGTFQTGALAVEHSARGLVQQPLEYIRSGFSALNRVCVSRDTNKTGLIISARTSWRYRHRRYVDEYRWHQWRRWSGRAGLPNRQCCCAGGVCVQRVRARQMSPFGDNLIERLGTRLVDVRPQISG